MPENDLGTAHGRIKIDVDDRGATRAERSLQRFERTMRNMQRTMQQVERRLTAVETELQKVSTEFDKTDVAAQKTEKSFDRVHRTTQKTQVGFKNFRRDLFQTWNWLHRVRDAAEDTIPPLSMLGRTLWGLNRNQGGLIGAFKVLGRAGALSAGVGALAGRMVGLNGAMRDLSDRQKTLLKFGRTILAIGGLAKLTTLRLKFLEGSTSGFGARLGQIAKLQLRFAKGNSIVMWGLGKLEGQMRKTAGRLLGLEPGLRAIERRFLSLGTALGPFGGTFTKLGRIIGKFGDDSAGALGRFAWNTRRSNEGLTGLARTINTSGRGFQMMAKGLTQAVVGLGLFRHGLATLSKNFGFLINMPLKFKLAIGLVSIAFQALMQYASKALIFISNLFVGLWSSIQQLSGAALALPGIFATMGVALGTLKAAFAGVKTIFEDVFKAETVEELNEALKNVPDGLKPLARQLFDVKKQFKDFSKVLAGTLLQGADGQLANLNKTYFGTMSRQMQVLTNEFTESKNVLADFLTQQQTVNDLNQAFIFTQGTVQNLNNALMPFLQGLRDVAIVGMEFVRNFTAGSQGLAERFRDWAAANRENGRLMQWMKDGVQGAKDLVSGLWNLTKALWSIVTLFQTVNASDDFLGNFADSMERFNNAVNQSKVGGKLSEIRAIILNMGTDKIELFKEVWDSVWPIINNVAKIIGQLSAGFKDTFIPLLGIITWHLDHVIGLLQDSGLAKLAGWVLGLAAAWKVLMFAMGTTRAIMAMVVGSFALLRGAGAAMIGFGRAMSGIIPGFALAGKAVSGMGSALAALGGPIGVALAALAAIGFVAYQGSQEIAATNKNIEAYANAMSGYGDELKKAFVDDRGLVGKGVLDTTKTQMDELMQAGEKLVAEGPGWSAHVTDFFKQTGQAFKEVFTLDMWGDTDDPNALRNRTGVDSNALNAQQEAVDKAKQVKEALTELGATNEDVAQRVTGTKTSYDEFVNSLRNTENGGQAAIDQISKLRAEFEAMQADFAAAGPGGAKLAAGIKQLGDAGGDATSKLEGLKLALEGLGLIQTSAIEKQFAYAEAVRNLATEAQNAVDSSAPLNDILNAQGNGFNYASVNGQNLFNVLKGVADAFLDTVANGKSATEAYGEISPRLDDVAKAFGITREQVETLIRTLGIVPNEVDVLVQLAGKDEVLRGVTQVALQAQQWINSGQGGINIPIIVEDPKGVEARLEQMFGDIADTTESGIKFKFDVDPGALKAVWDYLATQGITRGADGQLQLPPAQIPAAPPGQRPPPANPRQADGPQAPAPAPPPAPVPVPAPAPPPVDEGKVNAANAALDDLKKKMEEIDKFDPSVDIKINPPVSDLLEQIASFDKAMADFAAKLQGGKLEFTIIAKGYDETNFVLGTVVESITKLIAEVDKIQPAFVKAFATTPLDNFNNRMAQMAEGMYDNGYRIISELARGMLAAKAEVEAISPEIAQAINDYLQGRSPTKKGPLSGRGWTYFSGQKVVEAYAEGMSASQGEVAKSGGRVAGSVGSALKGPFDIEAILGKISTLVDFGSKIVDVFSQVADTIFNTIKFVADPMNKGTWFGQSKGAAFGFGRDPSISDADLAKKREDAALKEFQDRDKRTGLKDLPGIAGIGQNGTPEEIAAAILGEATKRGYSQKTAEAITAAALKESGLNVDADNGSHESLFQTSYDKEVGKNASAQLEWMFDKLDELGGPTAVDANPYDLIADKVEIGGYSGSTLQAEQGQNAADMIKGMVDGIANAPIGEAVAQSFSTDQALLSNVPSGSYANEGNLDLTKGLADCSSAVEDLVNLMDGAPTGGREMSTANAAQWLSERGFIQGKGDLGDFRVAFNSGHMQATLPGGTNFNWGSDAAAALAGRTGLGADDPDLTSQYYRPGNLTEDERRRLANGELSLATQEDMLAELRKQTPALDAAITAGTARDATTEQQISALNELQRAIDSSDDTTAQGRQQKSALEGIKSDIMDQGGLTENQSPIDQAQQIAGAATSIAKDVFAVMDASLKSIGAAKNIADTLVRGISNTEDIYNMVDQVQEFINLAARVAGAVGSIASTAGSFTGGSDFGATSAVGSAASLISGALDTVNGIIDLYQEAYRIFGSYFGEFLGFLAGAGSKLEGDVKFLLDENDGTLKAYSADNPLDKRIHDLPGRAPAEQAPQIGEVNVYGGPGEDPRDTTRNMMFAVKSAGMGAGGLN